MITGKVRPGRQTAAITATTARAGFGFGVRHPGKSNRDRQAGRPIP